MTQTIEAAAKAVASASTEIVAVTSSMGPVSIEGYYDEVFAIPGLLLEIAKAEKGGAQAAVIACFDDTGLDAARALATIPVIGICEAAVATAAFIAQRFTSSPPWNAPACRSNIWCIATALARARQGAGGRHSGSVAGRPEFRRPAAATGPDHGSASRRQGGGHRAWLRRHGGSRGRAVT